MKVLRIRSEAVTASFRYPRIQIGRLPTFDMPPPATVYGHLAGVIGYWFEPDGLEFAYVFRHSGKGRDLETAQPLEPGSGKHTYKRRGWDFPVNVLCAPNPQEREFLLKPRLTLYLRGNDNLLSDFFVAFRNPEFAYILGRSQDLATCCSTEFVEVYESVEAFFSHTLLPYDWRPWVLPGTTVRMPYVVDYYNQRAAFETRYLQVTWPPLCIHDGSGDTINRGALPGKFVVDRSERYTALNRSLPRGLWFHKLAGGGGVGT